jgi:hypothetical protein
VKRWIALLTMFLAGCGDPLVSAEYRGEPILRLVGRIASLRGGTTIGTDEAALVSMFWNTDLTATSPALVEQRSVSTNVEFPNAFEVLVFDPPAEEHLLTSDARLGVGFLLVYVDRDGDRTFGAADTIIGGNVIKALVWAVEDLDATASPFGTAIPTGFSLVNLPTAECAMPPDDGRHEFTRGPPVRTCATDDVCPPDFACDATYHVCVPRDGFDLVIGDEFELDRARCGPR